jgi:hypothetical protein
MDEFDYQRKMDQFYGRIAAFVEGHQDVFDEMMQKERIFATLRIRIFDQAVHAG